jgi:hypothetical protein
VNRNLAFYAGLPIIKSPIAKDGRIFALTGDFWSGSEKVIIGITNESDVAHEARSIVRRGLKDVLRWLGEPTITGREAWEMLHKYNDERENTSHVHIWNSDPDLLDAFVRQCEHTGAPEMVLSMWEGQPGVDQEDLRHIVRELS